MTDLDESEDTFMDECDSCGETKMCIHGDDPFLSEVYDEIKACTLCEECWDVRRQDV